MLREEKCLEFVFEGRERIRVSDTLGEVVPDMRTELGESEAMSFAVEASEFEYACVLHLEGREERSSTNDGSTALNTVLGHCSMTESKTAQLPV